MSQWVDLHAHSTASDGTAPPEKMVQTAVAAGLHAVALTDHDTTGGIDAARTAAAGAGIRLVAGCELSAHDGDREVHVLALHLSDIARIAPALERFRAQRVARAAAMVERLAALGFDVTLDDVMREAGTGTVGRPHVARALIARGGAADMREAFMRWLGGGRPAYVEKPRLDVTEAISLAHAGGGLAIWAHPGSDGTHANVERLVAAGLDGVEVRHPGHSAADTARLLGIARDLSLLRSGGSDWHGATSGYRVLGNMNVPREWLDQHDARLAARAA